MFILETPINAGVHVFELANIFNCNVEDMCDTIEAIPNSIELPLKTYIFSSKSAENVSLPNNVELLTGIAGLITVDNLTVSYLTSPSTSENHTDIQSIIHVTKFGGYRGCDLFLSTDWPKEVNQFLSQENLDALRSTAIDGLIIENMFIGVSLNIGSSFIADMAKKLRPRYHFASGKGIFYQRPPYLNIENSIHHISPCTRFISLGQVNTSKDKDKKYLHALSLTPIIHQSNEEICEIPPDATDCPYIDVGLTLKHSAPQSHSNIENPVKRFKYDSDVSDNGGCRSQSFFFHDNSSSVSSAHDMYVGKAPSMNPNPVSEDMKTLFLGGLPREVTSQQVLKLFPQATSFMKPEGKNFGFLDFATHEAANSIVKQAANKTFNIGSRAITIGWGKSKGTNKGHDRKMESSIELMLTPPSEDAKTLFIGGLPVVVLQEELMKLLEGATTVRCVPGKPFAFAEFESHEHAVKVMTRAQKVPLYFHGEELKIGWSKENGIKASAVSIQSEPVDKNSKTLFIGNIGTMSANDIEHLIQTVCPSSGSLSIQRPEGKSYAFAELSSHENASVAMALLRDHFISLGQQLTVGWSKSRSESGGRFNSHDDDCWFCLSSPSVKTHLVISVGDEIYLAIPRGGIVELHILIIPIDCVSTRFDLSSVAKFEMKRYDSALMKLFESLNVALLRFERTLKTKGRGHMQIQNIAIPMSVASNALKVFMDLASHHNIRFHEIQESGDIDDILNRMEGGPYREYFYIEIPSITSVGMSHRRFLYIPAEEEKGSRSSFPMSFGLEVAAKTLNAPERANWNNCLLSEEAEVALADKIKNLFEPFEFNT